MWAGPRVTVAARSSIVRWAQRHGLIDEARSIEEIGMHCLYHPVGDLPEQTAQFLRGFDRVVSFLGHRTEIVSQRLAQVLGGRVFAVDPRPIPGRTLHIVGQCVDQLRGYGLAVDVDAALVMETPDREPFRARLRSRIGVVNGRVALCHPGSGGLAKCCPLEALQGLVGRMGTHGRSIAWMIGPDEIERFGPGYARRLEVTAPVLYEESVESAADLVCGADAFIGNDAGMTHVAALCGVKTIALFGPTDPRVWSPLGPQCRAVAFSDAASIMDEWPVPF